MEIRRHATQAPVWRRTWAGATMAASVKRFMDHNPFATREEILAHLGEGHDRAAEGLVGTGKLKRPATGVYTLVAYDRSHPEVEMLIRQSGAAETSGDGVARQTERIMRRESRAAEAEIARDRAADTLLRMRAKVFSRKEAEEKLGFDPTRGVEPHGPEVVEWARETSRRAGEIARSLDACVARLPHDQRRGTPRVTSMFVSEPEKDRPQAVIVNIRRLGTIYAIAGGKGRTRPLWKANTAKTGLTDEAAACIAQDLFGDRTFGEVMAVANAYAEEKDVALRAEKLPQFSERGPFDYSPRSDEKGDGARLTRLREMSDAGEIAFPAECILYVDDREDARILEALRGVAGMSVVVARLDCGDYHACWGAAPTQQIVIERKTGQDFEASIRDRRAHGQPLGMERLIAQGTACYLLQQGSPFGWASVQVDGSGRNPKVEITSADKTDASVRMALAGIRTVNTRNWQLAAKAIVDLVRGAMSLSGAGADPRTGSLSQEAECGTQANTAAGRPDDQS